MLGKLKSQDSLDVPAWACLSSGTRKVDVSYEPDVALQSEKACHTIFNAAHEEFLGGLGTYSITIWWAAVRRVNNWKRHMTKSWEIQLNESSGASRQYSKGLTKEREF